MMKKRLIVVGLSLALTALLIWTVPMVVGYAKARNLEGSFLVAECGCGHDVFYLVEDGNAYDYCPGHGEKNLIGSVSVSGNQLVALRAKDNAPYFELKIESGTYYLRYPSLKDDGWHPVEKITNPWRTYLRQYFPE